MPLNSEIDSLRFYTPLPLLFRGYVVPFVLIYATWVHCWINVWGLDEYYEAGIIVFVICGIVHVLTGLFCYWFVYVRAALSCSRCSDWRSASLVLVQPTPNQGEPVLLPISGGSFVHQKTKYIYNAESDQFLATVYPDNLAITHYAETRGFEEEELPALLDMFGSNKLVMEIPDFAELFTERATAPFFVFQVFCVMLWCLDEYWYYSLFTLFMLIIFEVTVVKQQLRNLEEIRKMGNKSFLINTFRNQKWRQVPSDSVVPGDVVSVCQSSGLVPCDLLVLRGHCIVDESLLTGESIPVMKESIEEFDAGTHFDFERDSKLHVMFGGTKVVQHTGPPKGTAGLRCQDGGVVCYVMRTGFSTSQGRLLKTILYGVKRVTANNAETFAFIIFMMIFAVSASAYVWIEGSKNPKRNRYKLFLECTLILTSVIPPELPIELSLAVNNSLLALSKLFVYCTEPFRIPFAGKVDVCCFDKTGTLTADSLVVEGVAGLDNSRDLVDVEHAPLSTVQVLASCHSLTLVDTDLVGDPLEIAMFEATGWGLGKSEYMQPKKYKSPALKIYRRFHFSSALKKMTTVVGYTPANTTAIQFSVMCKGAPEVIRNMLETVPSDYDECYRDYATKGSRVIALACKTMSSLTQSDVGKIPRDELESNLLFVGFAIVSCPLKPDTAAAVGEVLASSHLGVMITGDNFLTACYISQQVGITKPSRPVYSLNFEEPSWVWQRVNGSEELPVKDPSIVKMDLCLTGPALAYLHTNEATWLKRLLPNIKVYARVSPKQKELVVNLLKEASFSVLFCGDGTNDVAALKHAHVGIALLSHSSLHLPNQESRAESRKKRKIELPPGASEQSVAMQRKMAQLMDDMDAEGNAQVVQLGDASIAAPFTSKKSSVQAVCHVIKQGRCTLVTTLQMFKILAINALILAYSQSVLYLDGIKFSDSQATMQAFLLAGCFLFISRSKPTKKLSAERPLPNIFNIYTVSTVLFQFAVHFCSLYTLSTNAHDYMEERNETFVDPETKFSPTIVNSTVWLLSVFMQTVTFAVNYKGMPFMESLTSNKPLMYSICISVCTVIVLVSGSSQDLSEQAELVFFPSEFRQLVFQVMAANAISCFVIDRSLEYIFGFGKLRTGAT